MDKSDFTKDYEDIVNEINDFIATLNVPDDNRGTDKCENIDDSGFQPSLQKKEFPSSNMADTPQPKRVKAQHNFKGRNNDELCFTKGDIITLTQMVDGGWWEGTLNGKTGWFPSNYVKEFKSDLFGSSNKLLTTKGPELTTFKRESMQYYHNVVLQNVIETERTHVSEMSSVLQNYILPLRNSNILSQVEFSQLIGNLEDIVAFQQNFLADLEECAKLPPHQRRMGGVFIEHAPRQKELYLVYCANHPQAVAILQKKREELSKALENLGAPMAGGMTLTTYLSKPFTRLEKYPSLLKELERHIEENHIDRGDTQRAIAVYRDIANSCMETRKLKEMEYEIVTSAITEWEGEEISQLGEVVHLSQVKMITQTGEKFDRIFVLFPSVLVMLSMGPQLSGYHYEGKIPLSGMNVNKCSEPESFINGFEISGNMIEKMIVTCGTKAETNTWLDILLQQVKQTQMSKLTKPQSLQISSSQPSISTLTQAKTAKVSQSPLQQKIYKTWSMSCLRPAPPMRPSISGKEDALKSPRTGRKPGGIRRKPERSHSEDEYDYRWKRYDPNKSEDDALILRVIEAYCTSAKTRQTVNSSILSPHILIAEEEKIIIDDGGEDHMLEEKTLVDTVYSLKDQLKELTQNQKRMHKDLEDEIKARKRLENTIRKSLKSLAQSSWEENVV